MTAGVLDVVPSSPADEEEEEANVVVVVLSITDDLPEWYRTVLTGGCFVLTGGGSVSVRRCMRQWLRNTLGDITNISASKRGRRVWREAYVLDCIVGAFRGWRGSLCAAELRDHVCRVAPDIYEDAVHHSPLHRGEWHSFLSCCVPVLSVHYRCAVAAAPATDNHHSLRVVLECRDRDVWRSHDRWGPV